MAALLALATAVHPHVCGDDRLAPRAEAISSGSPPRVWGRRQFPGKIAPRDRFTPTCVGTTPDRSPSLFP